MDTIFLILLAFPDVWLLPLACAALMTFWIYYAGGQELYADKPTWKKIWDFFPFFLIFYFVFFVPWAAIRFIQFVFS